MSESETLIEDIFFSMNEDLADTVKAVVTSPISFLKLKNNLKKYGKFKLDIASVDMDTIRKKEAAKDNPEGIDKEKLETANKAKKEALKGKISAVEDRISQLATSDALRAIARLGKSKANLQANTNLLKIAQGEENDALKLKIEDAIEKDKESITSAENSLKKYAKEAKDNPKPKEGEEGKEGSSTSETKEERDIRDKKYSEDMKSIGKKIANAKAGNRKDELDKLNADKAKLANDHNDANKLADAKASGDKGKIAAVTAEIKKNKETSAKDEEGEEDTSTAGTEDNEIKKQTELIDKSIQEINDFKEKNKDLLDKKDLRTIKSLNDLNREKNKNKLSLANLKLKAAQEEKDSDKIKDAQKEVKDIEDNITASKESHDNVDKAVNTLNAKAAGKAMAEATKKISEWESRIKTKEGKLDTLNKDERAAAEKTLAKWNEALKSEQDELAKQKEIVDKSEDKPATEPAKPAEPAKPTENDSKEAEDKKKKIEFIKSKIEEYKTKLKEPNHSEKFYTDSDKYIKAKEEELKNIQNEGVDWRTLANNMIIELESFEITINEDLMPKYSNSISESFREAMIKKGLL